MSPTPVEQDYVAYERIGLETLTEIAKKPTTPRTEGQNKTDGVRMDAAATILHHVREARREDI